MLGNASATSIAAEEHAHPSADPWPAVQNTWLPPISRTITPSTEIRICGGCDSTSASSSGSVYLPSVSVTFRPNTDSSKARNDRVTSFQPEFIRHSRYGWAGVRLFREPNNDRSINHRVR